MRVKGNIAPNTASVEPYAPMEGYAEVRLRENISEASVPDEMGGGTVTMFAYDEYTMHVKNRAGLQAEIEANLSEWLTTARSLEITGGESLVRLYEDALTELGVLPLETEVSSDE